MIMKKITNGIYLSFSFFLVENLNGQYSGQKLMELVMIKAAPMASNIIAKVPLIICVKYKIAMITAATIRIILSAVPIFFSIIYNL
jgi:hypothetical protein